MGLSSHIVIPNIISPVNLTAGAGVFSLPDGKTFLGDRVGGLINGIEKISFYFNVSALVGTLTLTVDSSLDGVNFTSGGKVANEAISSTGETRVDYIGAPMQILRFGWSLPTGDSATVQSIGLEGGLS